MYNWCGPLMVSKGAAADSAFKTTGRTALMAQSDCGLIDMLHGQEATRMLHCLQTRQLSPEHSNNADTHGQIVHYCPKHPTSDPGCASCSNAACHIAACICISEEDMHVKGATCHVAASAVTLMRSSQQYSAALLLVC